MTSREALVSSPGSCPSSRSASAAAAHPGVQQVLNLRALPPWQPLRSFSQHHALLGGGAEVSNLARWRSVITIQPLLYRILSPWCRSPGCTANHGAVLAPSSFILPAKKYGFICRVSAEKRLACHVIAGTQWQRQPGRAGPQNAGLAAAHGARQRHLRQQRRRRRSSLIRHAGQRERLSSLEGSRTLAGTRVERRPRRREPRQRHSSQAAMFGGEGRVATGTCGTETSCRAGGAFGTARACMQVLQARYTATLESSGPW